MQEKWRWMYINGHKTVRGRNKNKIHFKIKADILVWIHPAMPRDCWTVGGLLLGFKVNYLLLRDARLIAMECNVFFYNPHTTSSEGCAGTFKRRCTERELFLQNASRARSTSSFHRLQKWHQQRFPLHCPFILSQSCFIGTSFRG